MRVKITVKEAGTIGDLDKTKPHLMLTNESDTEVVREYFGDNTAVDEFDGFLVGVEDGDYTDVYGFYGSIPHTHKTVYKVTRTFSDENKYKGLKTKPRTGRKTTRAKTARSIGGIR